MNPTAEDHACAPCDLGAHEGCRGRNCDCRARPGCGRVAPRRRADAAIARASAGEDPWIDRLVGFIADLKAGSRFTTDRLWSKADEWRLDAPRNRRAMGGVIRKAASRKLIVLDEAHPPHRSVRAECHGRFVSVWIRTGPDGIGTAPPRPPCTCGATTPPARFVDNGTVILACLSCGFERPEEAP